MSASNITETQVLAWLRDKAASYKLAGLMLRVDSGADGLPFVASLPNHDDANVLATEVYGSGPTIDDAVARASLKAFGKDPRAKAAELRTEAAKLLARARELDHA
jgi:hypothetical protein